jgi:hypothetical protein
VSFLRLAVKHSNTTAIGLSMIAAAVAMGLKDPASLQQVQPWLLLLNGLGFLLAADSDADPQPPVPPGAVTT